MSNPFYTATGEPGTGAFAASAPMRSEFQDIEDGFDLMPNLTASTAVVVNSAGTALSNTVGTLSLAGNFATTGPFAVTLAASASVVLTLPPISATLVYAGGPLGTPSSGVATNLTGLSLTTGVAGVLPVTSGGTGVTTSTGSGAVVLSTSPSLTSPSLVTPILGVATATSVNGVTIPMATDTAVLVAATQTLTNKTLTAAMLGSSTATTQSAGTNNTTVATTAYLDSKLGASNGIATLNSGGTLTTSQIPPSLVGAVVFEGTWNASTNTPTLTSSVGTKGQYYIVNVTGTTNLDGITTWNVGDTAIFGASTWQRIPAATGNVVSVAGYTGAVVLAASDLTNGASGSGAVALVNGATFVNPALGTPASATLTNATGLPISTGVSGLGTNVATFLATPSVTNLNAAVTGGPVLFSGGSLGTPASGTATNITGLPGTAIVAGALANGMTATTQSALDASTKLATTLYVDSAVTAGQQFTTGDVKLAIKIVADPGWVLITDGTIGSASSSATYANANASALYSQVWNVVSDTYAPVTGGRGLTAAADFAANKPMALTKMLGRAIMLAGLGAGLTSRVLGQTGGAETYALAEGNLPAQTLTFVADGAEIATVQNTTGSPVYSSTGGGPAAFSILDPYSCLNAMIKL